VVTLGVVERVVDTVREKELGDIMLSKDTLTTFNLNTTGHLPRTGLERHVDLGIERGRSGLEVTFRSKATTDARALV
jgi:hypothetical protein